MFFAALMSRSCREPPEGNAQGRVDRLSSPSRCPHAEQDLELGYQRLITITSLPRTKRVLARCRKSRRASRTLRWARATFALALDRFTEPFRQRDRRRG